MRALVMRAAIFALCAITVVCNSFADVDLYVSTSGTDENDGLSSETPKLTLESAIIAATNGLANGVSTNYNINVADGPYTMMSSAGLIITNGVNIVGNVDPTKVIISSQTAAGSRLVRMYGGSIYGVTLKGGVTTGNSNNRVSHFYACNGAQIENCIITDTNLNGDGGYICNITGKNTKIKNTIIRNNVGYGASGWLKSYAALYLNDYAVAEGVVVSNISIRYYATNKTDHGAPICMGANTTLRSSLVCGNTRPPSYTYYTSVGVKIVGANALLEDCVIANNTAQLKGYNKQLGAGGLLICANNATIRRTAIRNNNVLAHSGADEPGGVHIYNSNARFENCQISGNTCDYGATAGVKIEKGANTTFVNCSIYGNKKTLVEGLKAHGVCIYDATTVGFYNSMIANNGPDAGWEGGLNVYHSATKPTFTNCLLSAAEIETYGNETCISGDPLMRVNDDGSYSINQSSPLCDAGADYDGIVDDLRKVARPQFSAIDIGCYEAMDVHEGWFRVSSEAIQRPSNLTVDAFVSYQNDVVKYEWILDDGSKQTVYETTSSQYSIPFAEDLPYGDYTVSLKVYWSDGTISAMCGESVLPLKPGRVYVANTGSNVYPYDTWETAANNLEDAVLTVYGNKESPGVVYVAEGNYSLLAKSGMTVPQGVKVTGVGERDKTIVNGVAHGNTHTKLLKVTGGIVENLTFIGGYFVGSEAYDNKSDAVSLNASNGSIVSNCVFKGASAGLEAGYFVRVINEGTRLVDSMIFNMTHSGAAHGEVNGVLTIEEGAEVNGCIISNNSVRLAANEVAHPGGVVCVGFNAKLKSCVVTKNVRLPSYPFYSTSGVKIVGSGALVEDCVIENNRCDLRAHDTQLGAGGLHIAAANATVRRTIIRGNLVRSYSGATEPAGVNIQGANALLENCLISDNITEYGPVSGLYVQSATAKIINCTIVGNSVTWPDNRKSHGVYSSVAALFTNDVIILNGPEVDNEVFGNVARASSNAVFSHCCLGTGERDFGDENCIYGNPQMKSDGAGGFEIDMLSPLCNAGAEVLSVTDDLNGLARPQIGKYDIGCYEAPHVKVVELKSEKESLLKGDSVKITVKASDQHLITKYEWTVTCGDSTETTMTDVPEFVLRIGEDDAYGERVVSVKAYWNGVAEEAKVRAAVVTVRPAKTYVSLEGLNVWPYDTLETAATNVQSAIDAVYAADDFLGLVEVHSGSYTAANGNAGGDWLFKVEKPIVLYGVGEVSEVELNGELKNRVLYMADSRAVVSNLTIRNARSQKHNAAPIGFGVHLIAGLLTDCFVKDAQSDYNDSATQEHWLVVDGGRINRCRITGKKILGQVYADNGMDLLLMRGVVENSKFHNNYTTDRRGGSITISGSESLMRNCDIYNNTHQGPEKVVLGAAGLTVTKGACVEWCRIYNNRSTRTHGTTQAGGVCVDNATIENSVISNNTCATKNESHVTGAGGVLLNSKGVIRNSLVVKNSCVNSFSSGVIALSNSQVINCTIANNGTASCIHYGGLYAKSSYVTNSIVSGNLSGKGEIYNLESTFGYCCVPQEVAGEGNIVATPIFRNSGEGDFTLRGRQPCINGGCNIMPWASTALDLNGNSRKFGTRVDIGCYENRQGGFMVIVR